MSLNSALLTGVSGLLANSTALSAISNNIANANTIGFKQNITDFESVVTASTSQSSGGAGVLGLNQQLVTQQGDLQQTTSNTDLGISGNGFFVVTDKATNLTAIDPRSFTRAGSFTVDKQGYLQNSAGLYLQGWPVDAEGNVSIDPSDLTRLQAINVEGVGGTADPTTIASVNANLQSGQTVSAAALAASTSSPGAGAYNPATNNMASYNATTGTGVKPDFSLQIPVSDSQGNQRTVEVDFLKSTTPNQWYAEVRAVPASDVTTGSGLVDGQLAVGTVAFTPDGQLDPTNTTLFADPTNPVINFGASAAAAPGAGQVNWAPSLGIAAQSLTLNLGQSPGGLTQFDSQSVTQSVTTNGTAFGNLTNIDIDSSGFVTANFDNGVSRRIAQVALATFPNPDGLKAVSGSAYQVATDSGTYNLKAPGTGGAGTLSPSTLESSTVDLATQFTGLITTQQAYSASSKVITTADQMMQVLMNMKQ